MTDCMTDRDRVETITYRLSWESISPTRFPHLYNWSTERARSDIVRSVIPNDYWTESHRDTDDPWDQLNGLRRLRLEGEFIRAIKLFRLIVVTVEDAIEVDEP